MCCRHTLSVDMNAPSHRSTLLPDAPRSDLVERLRELARIVDQSLPTHVTVGVPYEFPSVAALLLSRLAGSAHSVAELVEAGRDLDAGMLMRGALEHVTLLAWLAIDPTELEPELRVAREWSARGPDDNTRWWVASEFDRDIRRARRVASGFPARHNEREHQDALSYMRRTFAVELDWGKLPRVDAMAAEADACWGGQLAGWPDAEPGQPGYDSTLRGFNQILHEVGNTSAHPHLGALTSAFTDEPNAGRTAPLHAEIPSVSAQVPVATTAYLMIYAISVAGHALGWSAVDEALGVLGRFADVRHPGMLLDAVTAVLGGVDGRRFGTTSEGGSIFVARCGDETTVVHVAADVWLKAKHKPGPAWTLEDGRGTVLAPAGRHEMTGDVVAYITAMLEAAHSAVWLSGDELPEDWPADTLDGRASA